MVLLYMVTFTINIPQILAYIPYMDPMGNILEPYQFHSGQHRFFSRLWGLGPRLTGSLAYILPLTEAFKFMLPLVQQFPPLGVIFGPITLLTVLLNTIPFIPLILFVTFIIFAQVKESRHI